MIATYVDLPAGSSPKDSDGLYEPVIAATYLVEPLRASSAVMNFSGMLGSHSNRRDKCTGTMQAFSHFVIASSACQYMFSDIQGSTVFIHIITGPH